MSLDEDNVKVRKHQTLLRKYDMSVSCLSFEHIENCNIVKELEKIIKILRSGEEGCYPHLELAAESKLHKLAPNNHLLRIEVPVTPISALSSEERHQVSNDLQAWTNEMLSRESLLTSTESLSSEVPAIRDSAVAKVVNETNIMKSASSKPKEKPVRKCMPNDYTFWNKFDADSEILKMDLEEERQEEKKVMESKQKEERQKLKVKELKEDEGSLPPGLSDDVGAGDGVSFTEREFNALQEKNKGNEYFRNGDLTKALHHYSRSVSFLPNADAFNNRAQTYLKLNDFRLALRDCEEVLKLDPVNPKAYYRHGVAMYHLKEFQDALEDFEHVLKIIPNDKNTQEYAQKACKKLGIFESQKSVRMNIQTKASSFAADAENSEDSNDKYYPFFNVNPNDDIVLNEIGTAKVMCRCNGTPGFMKKVRSLDDLKEHGSLCLRRNSRSQKRTVSQVIEPSSSEAQINVKSDPKAVNTKKISEVCDNSENSLKNKSFDENSKKSGSSHLHTKPQSKQDALSNLENTKTPYSFSVFWSSIKGKDDLPIVAEALRLLCPELICQVVGNKLDDKMLSFFILALRAHFLLPDEWGIVQRYLLSLTQLPRFSIVNMMLDKATKKELEMLLNDAESRGLRVLDLLPLYGLTSCP